MLHTNSEQKRVSKQRRNIKANSINELLAARAAPSDQLVNCTGREPCRQFRTTNATTSVPTTSGILICMGCTSYLHCLITARVGFDDGAVRWLPFRRLRLVVQASETNIPCCSIACFCVERFALQPHEFAVKIRHANGCARAKHAILRSLSATIDDFKCSQLVSQ